MLQYHDTLSLAHHSEKDLIRIITHHSDREKNGCDKVKQDYLP